MRGKFGKLFRERGEITIEEVLRVLAPLADVLDAEEVKDRKLEARRKKRSERKVTPAMVSLDAQGKFLRVLSVFALRLAAPPSPSEGPRRSAGRATTVQGGGGGNRRKKTRAVPPRIPDADRKNADPLSVFAATALREGKILYALLDDLRAAGDHIDIDACRIMDGARKFGTEETLKQFAGDCPGALSVRAIEENCRGLVPDSMLQAFAQDLRAASASEIDEFRKDIREAMQPMWGTSVAQERLRAGALKGEWSDISYRQQDAAQLLGVLCVYDSLLLAWEQVVVEVGGELLRGATGVGELSLGMGEFREVWSAWVEYCGC